MYKILATFCFMIFFSVCSIYGQQRALRGIITSGASEVESSFIIVEIYDTTFRRIDYIPLEEENSFETTIDTLHKQINLVVSQLGCDTYIRKINLTESASIFLTIQLQNCTQQLDEVVVSAKQTYIKEQGDTLTFDVKGFKKDTDLNLGDILSRIPGIDITSTNQILYQGKRVQHIWVQGRDILNNQHGLALEGLKAEDIKEIQIIHDYKPFHKRFSQEHSGEVAMNIGLKDAAVGKVNGDVEALFGIGNKYNLDVDAIRVKANGGYGAFFRSNNIGKQVIQPLEYLGLVTDFSRLTQNRSGNFSLLPKSLMPQADAFKENQHLLSVSSDFNVSKKTKAIISFLGLYKTIEKKADVQTNFFDSNTTFLGDVEEQSKLPLFFTNINLKHEHSKNFLLELDMPISFNQQRSEYSRNGTYADQPYESFFLDEEYQWHYTPKLSLNIRHRPTWSSQHTVVFEAKNNRFNKIFSENSNNTPLYDQRWSNHDTNLTLSSSLENKHKIFLLKLWNRIELGQFSTNMLADNLLLYENGSTKYGYRWQNWKPAVQYGIRNANLMTHIQLELAQENRKTASEKFRQTWLNPLFRFKYNWSLLKFIGFSLSQDKTYIDQQSSLGVYLLEDNFQIRHHALEAGKNRRTQKLDFYYHDLQKDTEISFRTLFHYERTTNTLAHINKFEHNFIVNEVFVAPQTKELNLNVSFSHPMFDKKYLWEYNLDANYTTVERDPYANIYGRQLGFGLGVATNEKKKWNTKIKTAYQVSQQKQGTLDQTWHHLTAAFEFRYITQKWNTELDYKWHLSRVSSNSVHLHELNFAIDHVLSSRWSVVLRGQDALNIKNTKSLKLIATPMFIERNEFVRLQGSLMLGIKYVFGS